MTEATLRRRSRKATDTGVWRRDVDLEPSSAQVAKKTHPALRTLVLAWGSLGVIYGDTFASLFPTAESVTVDRVLGATSMIFYVLVTVVLLKYVLVALSMTDNGEGGIFALYTLLCRSCGFHGTPGRAVHASDVGVRSYVLPAWERRLSRAFAQRCRDGLARSHGARLALLGVALLGVSLILADGIMTPAVSVVSAVEGIQQKADLSDGTTTGIAVAILAVLFAQQPFGTGYVSALFSPVITLWLVGLAGVGIANLVRHGAGTFRALSPYYVHVFWRDDPAAAWKQLSSVLLAVTGAEALYADVGHFSPAAVRVGFTLFVFPCLVLNYLGQAAVIIADPVAAPTAFWSSLPSPVYWPMLVVACLAAVVASQALISGAFSIAQQAIAMNCFPRLTVRFTSKDVAGRVFCPEMNAFLAVASMAVVAGFGTGAGLTDAYGFGIALTFALTTGLLAVASIVSAELSIVVVAPLALAMWVVEGAILSSAALKVPHGAWFTVGAASVIAFVLATWTWGQGLKREIERRDRVPLEAVVEAPGAAAEGAPPAAGADAGSRPGFKLNKGQVGGRVADAAAGVAEARPELRPAEGSAAVVPAVRDRALRLATSHRPVMRAAGVGIYYSDHLDCAPPVLRALLAELPALHEVVVVLTVRRVPVPSVGADERFLVRRLPLPGVFHVVARWGYVDRVDQGGAFADALLDEIAAYLEPEVAREAREAVEKVEEGREGGADEASAARPPTPAPAPLSAPAAPPLSHLAAIGASSELTIGSVGGVSRRRLAAAARAIAQATRDAEEGRARAVELSDGTVRRVEALADGRSPNAARDASAAPSGAQLDASTGSSDVPLMAARAGDLEIEEGGLDDGEDATQKTVSPWVQQPSVLRKDIRSRARPSIPSFEIDDDVEERQALLEARSRGVARVIGRTNLKASAKAGGLVGLGRAILLDRVYGTLNALAVPRTAAYGLPERGVLELGVTYHA